MTKPFNADVDESGQLRLLAAIAEKYGLKPGTTVRIEENANGLHLRRPVTQLARVYIEPTNRCNLDCITCIRNSWYEPLGEMSSTVFSRIVEDLKLLPGPPSVFLGGLGEPLSHPHLVDMVKELKSIGSFVELITNGTLLSKDLSKRLIDAGLDKLWVSLDGAPPESYKDVRLGAALPQVLANLREYRHPRYKTRYTTGLDLLLQPQLGIVFVAMKRNIADLPAVLSLANQLGSLHFLVTNILPYTPELKDEILYSRAITDTIYTSTPLLRSLDLPKMDISPTTREAVFAALCGDHSLTISGASFEKQNNRCPFIEKGSLAIRWDGDVSPCLALLHDHKVYFHDYERFLKRHMVGNVQAQSLEEIWSKPGFISPSAIVFRNSIFRRVFFAADVSCSSQTRKTASAVPRRHAEDVCGHRA